MKKFIAMLVLVSMLVASVAFATNVRFCKNLYGYNYAGSGKTKTIVRAGSVAEKVKKSGNWIQVKLDSKKKLWFKSDYLVETDDSTDGSPIYSQGGTNRSTATDTKGTAYKADYKRVRATGKVNIRKTPSLQDKSLGTLKKGKYLTYKGKASVDSRGVRWYKVSYKGGDAWVSSGYSKLEK